MSGAKSASTERTKPVILKDSSIKDPLISKTYSSSSFLTPVHAQEIALLGIQLPKKGLGQITASSKKSLNMAMGLLSSWETSPRNRFWWAKENWSQSNILFRQAARSWISSRLLLRGILFSSVFSAREWGTYFRL